MMRRWLSTAAQPKPLLLALTARNVLWVDALIARALSALVFSLPGMVMLSAIALTIQRLITI